MYDSNQCVFQIDLEPFFTKAIGIGCALFCKTCALGIGSMFTIGLFFLYDYSGTIILKFTRFSLANRLVLCLIFSK